MTWCITVKQSARWVNFFKRITSGLVFNSVSDTGWVEQFPDGKYIIHFPLKHRSITVVPCYHDGYNSLIPKHGYRFSYYVWFKKG